LGKMKRLIQALVSAITRSLLAPGVPLSACELYFPRNVGLGQFERARAYPALDLLAGRINQLTQILLNAPGQQRLLARRKAQHGFGYLLVIGDEWQGWHEDENR